LGCLGLHFGLTDREVTELLSLKGDAERLEYVQEDLEENFWADHPEFVAETDKAWDAIHRSLTDGRCAYDNGTYPLNHVVLGGEVLYGRDDYIMVLKTACQVADVAAEIHAISEDQFRKRFLAIDEDDYGFPVNEGDLAYTWQWFCELRDFWMRCAENGRYVLFTASQ
jgi:hypothetical protein